MADQKVSDLPSLSGADVDPADLLYIIDSSAGSAGSKKITVGQYQLAPVSGGTANTVVYLNGSKVESSSSALTFDGTNFATTGTASATKLIPIGGSATGNGMYLPAANTLAWSNNGLETLRLDSSGNLGLGVTPSAWSTTANIQLATGRNISAGTGIGLYGNAYFDAGWKYIDPTYATGYGQSGGSHAWFTAPPGTAGNAISFTQAMTLDASGNLLVGRTTSNGTAYRFEVDSSSDTRIGINVGGSLTGLLQATTNTLSLAAIGASGVLTFNSNGQERARITSGGDLLVGTTSSLGAYRVQVVGTNSGIVSQVSSNAESPADLWSTATTGNNIFERYFTEGGTGTQRGSIDYNRAGGLVRYNTTSDYRAKDIIGPVQNVGATIDALKVYEGVMKGATQSRPMLIAHEAQEHVPFCVSGTKDEENEDGTPKFQQMDHASLVPLLLAEIQSLRARVAALESA